MKEETHGIIVLLFTGFIITIFSLAFFFPVFGEIIQGKEDIASYKALYTCNKAETNDFYKNPECFEFKIIFQGEEKEIKSGETLPLGEYMSATPTFDATWRPLRVERELNPLEFTVKESYEITNNDVADLVLQVDTQQPELNEKQNLRITLDNKFHENLIGKVIIMEKKIDIVRTKFKVIDFNIPLGVSSFNAEIDTSEVGDEQYIVSYEFDFFGKTYQGKDINSVNIAVGKDLIGDRFPEPIIESPIKTSSLWGWLSFIIGILIIIIGLILWGRKK